MTAQGVDAGASLHIPNLASAIDATSDAALAAPIKRAGRDFPLVSSEAVDAAASLDVP